MLEAIHISISNSIREKGDRCLSEIASSETLKNQNLINIYVTLRYILRNSRLPSKL